MHNRRFLFIVNPVSGGIKKDRWIQDLRKHLQLRKMNAEIAFPSSGLDTRNIAEQGVKAGIDALVACGGDGTINDIARRLVSTSTALGVIPMGSGNGFARALKIPFRLEKALEALQLGDVRHLDSGRVNERFFANIAGLGFDAHVAGLFRDSKRRGLSTYTKIVLMEYRNYRPETYRISIGNDSYEQCSFFSAVCNGSQFGNDFTIAPGADMQDGMLEIIDVKKPLIHQVPKLAINAMQRRFDKNKLVESHRGQSIKIERNHSGLVNIDGEPELMGQILQFLVEPSSLPIIIR
jgi:diacylglycerol kinase (ATP)